MNLLPIEERLTALTANGEPLFSRVSTAVDNEAVIEKGIIRADSAFVVPMGEQASNGQIDTYQYKQDIQVSFGVMIGVREVNDLLGKNINARLHNIVSIVRNSLAGWEVDGEHDAINFASGEIVAFLNRGAFWMEQYTTTYRFTRSNP